MTDAERVRELEAAIEIALRTCCYSGDVFVYDSCLQGIYVTLAAALGEARTAELLARWEKEDVILSNQGNPM